LKPKQICFNLHCVSEKSPLLSQNKSCSLLLGGGEQYVCQPSIQRALLASVEPSSQIKWAKNSTQRQLRAFQQEKKEDGERFSIVVKKKTKELDVRCIRGETMLPKRYTEVGSVQNTTTNPPFIMILPVIAMNQH